MLGFRSFQFLLDAMNSLLQSISLTTKYKQTSMSAFELAYFFIPFFLPTLNSGTFQDESVLLQGMEAKDVLSQMISDCSHFLHLKSPTSRRHLVFAFLQLRQAACFGGPVSEILFDASGLYCRASTSMAVYGSGVTHASCECMGGQLRGLNDR